LEVITNFIDDSEYVSIVGNVNATDSKEDRAYVHLKPPD
jgi:hypothetical protein